MAEDKLAMTAPQAAALAKPQIDRTQIDPESSSRSRRKSPPPRTRYGSRRDALNTVGRQYDPIFQKVDEMPLTPEHSANI